jgi:hypothetical protein
MVSRLQNNFDVIRNRLQKVGERVILLVDVGYRQLFLLPWKYSNAVDDIARQNKIIEAYAHRVLPEPLHHAAPSAFEERVAPHVYVGQERNGCDRIGRRP